MFAKMGWLINDVIVLHNNDIILVFALATSIKPIMINHGTGGFWLR